MVLANNFNPIQTSLVTFPIFVGVITPLATRGGGEGLDHEKGRERGRDKRDEDQDPGAGLGEDVTPLPLDASGHTHMHTP